jgi:hypothetical protein
MSGVKNVVTAVIGEPAKRANLPVWESLKSSKLAALAWTAMRVWLGVMWIQAGSAKLWGAEAAGFLHNNGASVCAFYALFAVVILVMWRTSGWIGADGLIVGYRQRHPDLFTRFTSRLRPHFPRERSVSPARPAGASRTQRAAPVFAGPVGPGLGIPREESPDSTSRESTSRGLVVLVGAPPAEEPGHPAGSVARDSHARRQCGDDMQPAAAFGVPIAGVTLRPWAAGVFNPHAHPLPGAYSNFHAEMPAGKPGAAMEHRICR